MICKSARRHAAAFLLIAGLVGRAGAADAVPDAPAPATRPASAATEPTYKAMPWHLVDTWWDIGKDSEFDSYRIDVTISDDVPADVRLYVAPVGIGQLNGAKFYGGLQTRSDATTKHDLKLREIGPGLIFSMWGERSLDAIRPADGGFCQSSGHEGDFVSVRRPFAWKRGRYTYRVARMEREMVDGKPCRWVGAFLDCHDGPGETIFIGALRFKGDTLTLGRSLANFVEIYGPRRPVGDIPQLTITFGNLRINGEPVAHATAKAVYPKGVPDYAQAEGKDGQIVVTVGRPVNDRKERNVILIGKE